MNWFPYSDSALFANVVSSLILLAIVLLLRFILVPAVKHQEMESRINIATICGSVQPGNYTAKALALAVDELNMPPKVKVNPIDLPKDCARSHRSW